MYAGTLFSSYTQFYYCTVFFSLWEKSKTIICIVRRLVVHFHFQCLHIFFSFAQHDDFFRFFNSKIVSFKADCLNSQTWTTCIITGVYCYFVAMQFMNSEGFNYRLLAFNVYIGRATHCTVLYNRVFLLIKFFTFLKEKSSIGLKSASDAKDANNPFQCNWFLLFEQFDFFHIPRAVHYACFLSIHQLVELEKKVDFTTEKRYFKFLLVFLFEISFINNNKIAFIHHNFSRFFLLILSLFSNISNSKT